MYPKPQPRLSPLQKRLPGRRNAVTVALGMTSTGAIFVCADSNVVSNDGMVISGYKLAARESRTTGSYVIGNASNDGNAANMIAEEILKELSAKDNRNNIEPIVKRIMKRWHSSYTRGDAPPMQFILAVRTGLQSRRLYFCEPPSTVLLKPFGDSIVVGTGASTVEPLLQQVILGPLRLREALIRAAYLMYRAKKDHALIKGSDTDVLVINEADGDVRQVSREEMTAAEALGPDVDFMLRYCYLGLLGVAPEHHPRDFLKGMNKKYREARKRADKIIFPSLAGMKGH